jgi:glutamyl-tRNA synthetase
MASPVVVRFAPSPSGYLHVGGARTAIFNWLWARQNNGKLILRIEDTDASRSSDASVQGIIDSLKWLGIDWDEGPYFQSQYVSAHQATARQLLAAGHAYRCFCTQAELEQKRLEARRNKQTYRYDGKCRRLSAEDSARRQAAGASFLIRFSVPRQTGAVRFSDRVYGAIEKKYADLEDFVLVRSNGQPLYVLSNAVDDIRDGITHIIRGQDGLANTPKQILIYQALKQPRPVFAHMSLALDPSKAKISKRRHGSQVAIHYYREQGFIPWAMVNFLALLGWSTSDAKQLFNPEELIAAFSLQGISRTNCIFDIRPRNDKFFTDPKLLNINTHYLRSMPLEALEPLVTKALQTAGIWQPDRARQRRDWYLKTIDLIRSRFYRLNDFALRGQPYLLMDYKVDNSALQGHLAGHPEIQACLTEIHSRLSGTADFDQATLETVLKDVARRHRIKVGKLIGPLRMALTGQKNGPGILEVMELLDRPCVLARLGQALV